MVVVSCASAQHGAHDETSSLDRACVAGDVHACRRLGGMYWHGTGVPRDLERSHGYYQRACLDDERTPEACFLRFRVEREIAKEHAPVRDCAGFVPQADDTVRITLAPGNHAAAGDYLRCGTRPPCEVREVVDESIILARCD